MAFKNLSLRRKLIFCLDTVLFFLFVLNLSPRLTGLPLHEMIGVFLFFVIVVHILIEWKWFIRYFARFFKTAGKRDKFNLILNSLLFVAVIFEIISGLVISRVLAPYFNIKTINDAKWRFWHNQISTVTMFLVGFHLALSFRRIVSYFTLKKNLLPNKRNKIKIHFGASLYRAFIVLLLTVVVSVLSFLLLGKPSAKNVYTGDEIARFHPTLLHGAIQFFGETLIIVLTCFVAKKWLKVRL